MKKLELIALFVASALVEISSPVSLYTVISDAEHVAHDNRLPKKLQPVELMVDTTNQLGFKILNLHSNLNKNNIGFSPCGLMSVLVALYEGSSGRSTIELKEALEFPNERDIVRVGIRDIHRRLRVSAKKLQKPMYDCSINFIIIWFTHSLDISSWHWVSSEHVK